MSEADLEAAVDTLALFDVVLITNHLSSPSTTELLSRRLGTTESVPRRTFPTRAPSPEEADEDLFDEESLARLVDLNTLDAQLYHHAVGVYTESIRGLGSD